ncbi:MAG: YhfC family glutamic-type intramembrane protease, partial [Terrisporobacter sp.]
ELKMIKIGLGLSLLISFVTPIAMLIYCICKRRKMLKPFIIGVLVFFISQIVLRLPLLSFVLPNQIWYMKLSLNPYLLSIFLGLTAGIFEEVGRYIGFKYFLKNNQEYNDGIGEVVYYEYTHRIFHDCIIWNKKK